MNILAEPAWLWDFPEVRIRKGTERGLLLPESWWKRERRKFRGKLLRSRALDVHFLHTQNVVGLERFCWCEPSNAEKCLPLALVAAFSSQYHNILRRFFVVAILSKGCLGARSIFNDTRPLFVRQKDTKRVVKVSSRIMKISYHLTQAISSITANCTDSTHIL